MDRKNPLMIWINKNIPSKDPKFHIYEILIGVGKFNKDIFKRFIKFLFIL